MWERQTDLYDNIDFYTDSKRPSPHTLKSLPSLLTVLMSLLTYRYLTILKGGASVCVK